MEKNLLTTKEACAALRCTAPTLRRWARTFKIKRVHISSRAIRWPADELARFVKSKSITTR